MKNTNIKLKSLLTEQEENYIPETLKAVNAKLKELGFKKAMRANHFADSKFHVIEKQVLTPKKDLKPLAAGFEAIVYEVRVGGRPDGAIATIMVDYDWDYIDGGRNGYKIQYYYDIEEGWNI